MKLWTVLAAVALLPAPALAQKVSLTSEAFVERVTTDAAGKQTVTLEPPKVVTPGDVVVFVLTYENATANAANDFAVNNPLPESIELIAAGNDPLYSIDGKTFGTLASLRVPVAGAAPRNATAADVRHLRWTFAKPIAAGAKGTLRFRGRVR